MFKNARFSKTPVMLLAMTVSLFSTLAASQTESYDVQLIEALVHRMQRGIQKQQPCLILDYLYTVPSNNGVDYLRE